MNHEVLTGSFKRTKKLTSNKLIVVPILAITFSLFTHLCEAQIAINNTAANPDASAILDLNTGNAGVNKGFLPPQVALTNVTVAAPVISPATGLIVYCSTAPAGGNGIGYYYWNGSVWSGLGTSPVFSNLTQGTGITSFSYNGSSAATVGIANTGVSANSYGNTTAYPTFTVNAQGQLTVAGTQPLPASLPPSGTAGGNLSGTYPNPSVVWTSGETTYDTRYMQIGAVAGGDLSGIYPNPTVAKINGNSVPANASGALVNNGSGSLSWTAFPASLPPNGTAGGNLSGTYPNPTVAKVNGASVPAAGALTTGNVLQVNGASSTTYGPVNIAGGTNYITGNLPVANLNSGTNANATTFWRGDGTWANPTAAALSNLTQGTGITAFTYNGASTATVGLANTTVVAGSYGSATTVPTYTVNAQGQITGAANVTITGSSGTVTNFSSGSLAPLFTTSVANSTTTPALTFTLTHAAAYTILGNNTNASAAPTYFTPVLASNLFENQGYVNSVLHGNGSGAPYWGAVDLTTDVTNNLPVSNLNSGSGANSNTFWRGDGTWATPAGGSISGSGSNGYLALWTPNSTTLGTSVVQDDGTEIGVGIAPVAGIKLSVYSPTGYTGKFSDGFGDFVILGDTPDGIPIEAHGAYLGAVFGDASNDGAIIADGSSDAGISAAGSNYGGKFTDNIGDYANCGDGVDHYGINAYGSSTGGYFTDGGGDYAFIAYNPSKIGVGGDGVSYGGAFQDVNGSYNGYIGDAVNNAAASFSNNSGIYMYVCQGGSGYVTNGSKSTEVKDKNNNERLLFCNESPEVMFEDYGEGQLVNGKAHIALDSLFAMNVAISDKHPLRVFIQLEENENCKGVITKNKTANGFDVVELNGGTSNTPFEWHIICNRANEVGTDRDYAEKRFPIGPGAPKKPEMAMQKGGGTSKPVSPIKPTQHIPATKKASN